MPYKDPEKRRAYQRAWIASARRENPAEYRAKKEKWKKENPDKVKAWSRYWSALYDLTHREQKLQRQRRYLDSHREIHNDKNKTAKRKLRYGEFAEAFEALRELKQELKRKLNEKK